MNLKQFKKTFKDDLIWSERKIDPIVEGHFRATSGLCLTKYFDKRRLLMSPRVTRRIAAILRESMKGFPEFHTLIGMAPAASELAQFLSFQFYIHTKREIDAVWAEKTESGIVIPNSFEDAIKDMRVVIVEDVISTGKTASALKRLVESMEGTVVGMVSLASRMMWTPNVPAYCNLIQIDDPPVRCDECPLCKQDVPHNTVLGHG